MDRAGMGMLHHIELWVPSLVRAEASWGWLLGELGYKVNGEWPEGKSWQSGSTYIVLEQSPARIVVRHDRLRPGLNHLAFYAASREQVDALARDAPDYGWRLLFSDRHPHAGGPDHYAAYLEDRDGYEVELVAPFYEAPGTAPDPAAAVPEPTQTVPGPVQASSEPGQAAPEPPQAASGPVRSLPEQARTAPGPARAMATRNVPEPARVVPTQNVPEPAPRAPEQPRSVFEPAEKPAHPPEPPPDPEPSSDPEPPPEPELPPDPEAD